MKTWTHNRLLPRLTLILGLVTAGAAVLHIVAVIGVAYRERGGYDARLADLLWIGWTSLICGALMIASSRGLGRGSRTAFRTATGAAAVFLVGGMTIAPIDPSFWTAAPLYGGYLVLAFWLRRCAHPSGWRVGGGGDIADDSE
jgi:hypothetical protein